MPATTSTSVDALVLVDDTNGITVIPQLSELRRLNWFDGKLLRADDLRVEQDHVRGLVRRANRSGGRGVVDGLTVTQASDARLHIAPGMAIAPGGRSLLLPVDVALDVHELIEKTAAVPAARKPPAAGKLSAATAKSGSAKARAAKTGFADCVEPSAAGQAPLGGARWYVVSVGWAEGLCGNEEVYGRLCEDACTTSTDRPWRMDGLVFRARPITPRRALATSAVVALAARHERSLVASALFADEHDDAGSLIFGAGLRSGVWCTGAAAATAAHDEVPLALIGRAGEVTTFLDIWTARRERMEAPPRRYWDGRMSMRPRDVFLAQVLQFQCQLADMLDGTPTPSGGASDPCAERQRVLERLVAELEKRALPEEESTDEVLELFKEQVRSLRLASFARPATRVLIDGGIVELPPAGYLPVAPAARLSLEAQVRALLGDGVLLTFCAARADALARAFEEAQHLGRISLLTGLDDPGQRQDVEIVVPDAEILGLAARDGWKGRLTIDDDDGDAPVDLDGAGLVQTRDTLAMRWAGTAAGQQDTPAPAPPAPAAGAGPSTTSRTISSADDAAMNVAPATTPPPFLPPAPDRDTEDGPTDAYLQATVDRDPFLLAVGEAASFSAAADLALGSDDVRAIRAGLHGTFRLARTANVTTGTVLHGRIDAIASMRRVGGPDNGAKTINLDAEPAQLVRRERADADTQVILALNIDGRSVTVTLAWHGDATTVDLTAAFVEAGAKAGTGSARKAKGDTTLSVSDLSDTVKKAVISEALAAGQPQELARLTLRRDAGAATPGSPPRDAAEKAVRVIEQALADPDYAADAIHRLFGGNDDSGFRLRPVHDWVLFRRRAVLRCAGSAPAPVVTERYAVYGRVHTDDTSAGEHVHLGEVLFAGGSATRAGGAEAVASAWDDIARGASLDFVGVVSGAPGGDGLGLQRAAALVTAVSAVTKPASGLKPEILDPEDVDLETGGADGIIVLEATAPVPAPVPVPVPVPKTVVAVFAVLGRSEGYVRLMNDKSFGTGLGTAFAAGASVSLGPLAYEPKAISSADIPKIVTALTNLERIAMRVHVVSIAGEASAGDATTRGKRGAGLAAEFGGDVGVDVFEVSKAVWAITNLTAEHTIMLIPTLPTPQ